MMKALATPVLTLACVLSMVVPAARASDEDDVRAVIAKETDGWSKFDAKQVTSCFTDDAIWQNPFGVRFHKRADLEHFLTGLFSRPGYRSGVDTSATKILDLRFPAPGVAAVWSDESSQGQVDDNTGVPMLPRHSFYLEVLVKKNGVWKISDAMIMDQIKPSHR
jgi:uncharacterized protein (TIGR02246 family)